MITYKTGNILEEKTEAIVNTVNCVGVMGRGIALQYKNLFPENFKAYKRACDKGEVKLGEMFVFSLGSLFTPSYIINFPTKGHWKMKSSLRDIKTGLDSLKRDLYKYKINSIAIPPLGCGLGGLKWCDVKALIEETFKETNDVNVIVYEPSKNIDPIKSKQLLKLTPSRAALLVLMKKYLEGMLDPFISLLEIHKLMYFLQESGHPLRLLYKKALYGPYAENLRHVLNILEGQYISGYDGEDSPTKHIALLPGAVVKAENLLISYPDLREKLNSVAALVDGFESPSGLELLATVHWVVKKDNKQNLNDIINGVYSWNSKKRKFSEKQINLAFNVLKTHHWL